jgi:hypothetical protein
MDCYNCGKKAQYDTGWLGVHWCGNKECAYQIMEACCDYEEDEGEE